MKVIFICKLTRLRFIGEVEAVPQIGHNFSLRNSKFGKKMNTYKIVDVKYSSFLYTDKPKSSDLSNAFEEIEKSFQNQEISSYNMPKEDLEQFKNMDINDETNKEHIETTNDVNIEIMLKPIYYNFPTEGNKLRYSCKNCKHCKHEPKKSFCKNESSDKYNKEIMSFDTCLIGYREMNKGDNDG